VRVQLQRPPPAERWPMLLALARHLNHNPRVIRGAPARSLPPGCLMGGARTGSSPTEEDVNIANTSKTLSARH